MPRANNPYYAAPPSAYPTDPTWGIVGESLARALFGDPAARAEQELAAARIGEAEAQTRAADALADSRNIVLKSRGNLGDVFRQLYGPGATAPPPPTVSGDTIIVPPGFEGVAGAISQALPNETGGPAPALIPAGAPRPAVSAGPELSVGQIQSRLPEIIAALAQADMGGNIGEVMRTVGAFSNNDETARAALIAGGSTPTDDFAITPERADDIREQTIRARMAEELVQSRDRRYNTDVDASTQRRGQDVGSDTARRGQDIGSSDRRYAHDVPSGDTTYRYGGARPPSRGERNNNPGNLEDGPFARAQPGYIGNDGRFARYRTMEQGEAAQEQLLRRNYGGRSISGILRGTRRGNGYTPVSPENPEANVRNYEDYVARRTGLAVGEPVPPDRIADVARAMREFETGGQRAGTAPRTAASRPGARQPRPRTVKRADLAAVDTEIARRMGGSWDRITPAARRQLRARAVSIFQTNGNPVTAVEQAVEELVRIGRSGRGPTRTAAARPAAQRRIRYDAQGNRIAP